MSKNYLPNIQQIRGLAAFIVLIAHVLQSAQKRVYADDSYLVHGGVGVDIFFVISGFIMVGVTHDRFGSLKSVRDFLIRRIARIFPIYWIFTSLMFVLFSVAGKIPTLAMTASSFAFYPLEIDGKVRPLLGQGWTLDLEIMFYICFGLCLYFRKSVGISLLCIVMTALPIAGMAIDRGPFAFWTSPIILEFLVGVIIGLVFKATQAAISWRPLLPISAIIIAWLVAAWLFETGSELTWRPLSWCAAGVIVALAAFSAQSDGRGMVERSIIKLGDWSYSLYLVHIPILLVAAKISDELLGERLNVIQGASYAIGVIVASVFASGLSYRYIERPTEKFALRLLGGGVREHNMSGVVA